MTNINTEILRLGREARCITQEDLAEQIGIEQGTLSRIERSYPSKVITGGRSQLE
jgi:transcriptional regulator with XRE-family HTH domain